MTKSRTYKNLRLSNRKKILLLKRRENRILLNRYKYKEKYRMLLEYARYLEQDIEDLKSHIKRIKKCKDCSFYVCRCLL